MFILRPIEHYCVVQEQALVAFSSILYTNKKRTDYIPLPYCHHCLNVCSELGKNKLITYKYFIRDAADGCIL